MRDILFKAKRLKDDKWVEGYYIYHIKRTPCVFNDCVKPEDEQHVIMCDGFSDWNMPRDTVHYNIHPNTLCQYTGMTDKYGAKIWENDIVEAYSEGTKAIGRIKQRIDGTWIMYPAWQKQEFWYLLPNEQGKTTVRVIGNIFDNAELLEGCE